jgi:hypothetical protein
MTKVETCLGCLLGLSDTRLIENISKMEGLTPLENELVRRLEMYVEVYGDFSDRETYPWV